MTRKLEVLANLRQNTESHAIDKNGAEWGSVYLDNARPTGMSANEFRGCLSQLAKDGLYRPLDDKYFGDVKISD